MTKTQKNRLRIERLKAGLEKKKAIERRQDSARCAEVAKQRILATATTKREYAEILYHGMTQSERNFWECLKAYKFPQWYAQAIVRGYIVDFYAPESRLAIELDGRFHDPDRDRIRDCHLTRAGIKTMRYAGSQRTLASSLSRDVFNPQCMPKIVEEVRLESVRRMHAIDQILKANGF